MLKYFEELKEAIFNENLIETDIILENIKKESNSFDYINYILKLIEDNSNIYLGNPGPVVHFMELYYKKGYENLLLESVNNKPTIQTINMIRRIINGSKLKEKQKYIDTLKELLYKENINEEIKLEIKEILELE